jgi:predicted TIM-barrel fold metal-dependent hydrolase
VNESFVYDEIDRRVWEEELAPRLPARLFDVHSHAWRAAEYQCTESSDPSLPMVVSEYPPAELRAVHARLFPGKEVGGLCFGMGARDTNLEAQGEWLAEEAPRYGYRTLLFARPEWDEGTLRRQLERGHLGFKPYWYLAGDSLDEVTLGDMISPAMLRVAQARRSIVMTHIPRTGRLADPKNPEGLRRICEAAPQAQFVLAHLGRSYTPESIRPIDGLCDLPNLWADCSMVQDWEVIAHALSVFPRDRFLFGLDLPIAQEKGKLISVNGQRHFFTARPHRWSVHAEPGAYEVRCTLFAYEIVRALLKGAAAARVREEELQAIFWDNAQRLIGAVAAREEGR